MKRIFAILFVILVAFSFFGCKSKAKLADKPIISFEFVEMLFNEVDPVKKPVMKSLGKVNFKLYLSDAQPAAKLFLDGVRSGFYNTNVNAPSETEEMNERFRFAFNEIGHTYFIKSKFKLSLITENNVKLWGVSGVVRDTSTWSKSISAASNIVIKKGTLCLNSERKGQFIIFKRKLADAGKFVPIGQASEDSMEVLKKIFSVRAGVGQSRRTPQGNYVDSNPVTSRFIFIKKVEVVN